MQRIERIAYSEFCFQREEAGAAIERFSVPLTIIEQIFACRPEVDRQLSEVSRAPFPIDAVLARETCTVEECDVSYKVVEVV